MAVIQLNAPKPRGPLRLLVEQPVDMPDLSGAACREVADPDVFFPDPLDEVGTARAKRICAGCPVRLRCLAVAVENDEEFGIFGGLTRRERAKWARTAAAATARTGGAA